MTYPKNVQIVSVSKVVKIVKQLTERVSSSGNVCIYPNERKAVDPNDIAIIEVQDSAGTVVGQRTYSGEAFHKSLRDKEKTTKSGYKIKLKVIKVL